MSSPNMNNLIVSGCILTYLSVILLGLDTRMISSSMFEFMCTAKIWSLSFGFTLAFGSMFSKTWRVHSIFTNIKLNKKTYMEKNLKIEPHIEACYSPHAVIFQGLLMVFKGLQLISGCFLAWETRHVNVPALNDSKYIGASVYNVVVMCTLGVPISFVLRDHVNASYILISVFIVFCTTLTLGLVFIPKIVELVRNPKTDMNDRRFRRTMLASRHPSLRREISLNSIEDYRERLNHVERENSLWKKTLQEKVCEFYRLKARLDVIIGASVKKQESKNRLTVANAIEKQRLIRAAGQIVIENTESISTIDCGNRENAKAAQRANYTSPYSAVRHRKAPYGVKYSSHSSGAIRHCTAPCGACGKVSHSRHRMKYSSKNLQPVMVVADLNIFHPAPAVEV
uniref:G-protein coupled receptors family 3 profile domain-containing protein n=1 Tax=Romanomermis culicivorax TaxID=13658 RepID=A0A915IDW6_ROMCU